MKVLPWQEASTYLAVSVQADGAAIPRRGRAGAALVERHQRRRVKSLPAAVHPCPPGASPKRFHALVSAQRRAPKAFSYLSRACPFSWLSSLGFAGLSARQAYSVQSLQVATSSQTHANTPLSAQDKNPGADARAAFEALNKAHRELKDPGSRVRALPSPPAACACPRAIFQDRLQCMLVRALHAYAARPQQSALVSTCHQSS